MGTGAETKDENELLQAARTGNREALSELLLQHQQRIFGFGMKMCGDPEDARDVAQETMLSLVRSLPTFRGESSVSTWLYTVARSFCIKKRRRTKGAPAYHESLEQTTQEQSAAPAPTPEQTLLGQEAREAVASALDHLEPDAREVVILRDIEGLTAPEVATITGLSVAAVKSRLHRARQSLRQHLVAIVGDAPAPATPSCPDVLTLLSQKLEDDVSPDLCAQMEKHVEGCPHCKGLCDSLKRSLAVCRSFSSPTVPRHVQESLRQAVQAALEQHS